MEIHPITSQLITEDNRAKPDIPGCFAVPFESVKRNGKKRCHVTHDLVERLVRLKNALSDVDVVFERPLDTVLDLFEQDLAPEREIFVLEEIVETMRQIKAEDNGACSRERKRALFQALSAMSVGIAEQDATVKLPDWERVRARFDAVVQSRAEERRITEQKLRQEVVTARKCGACAHISMLLQPCAACCATFYCDDACMGGDRNHHAPACTQDLTHTISELH